MLNATDEHKDNKINLENGGTPNIPKERNQIKEISILGRKYLVDGLISETDTYKMYKIHDNLNREFGLKTFCRPEGNKNIINCIKLLKDLPGIASIFAYEEVSKQLNLVVELGTKVNISLIPANMLKRRMRQILTAVASVSSVHLHFSDIRMSDFIETNGGIRLLNIESTITNINNSNEKTFQPTAHLLTQLFDEKKGKLEHSMYRDLRKCVTTASNTSVADAKELLDSEIFRDRFKVTINKSNRAMTPDPHNLVLMKKKRRPVEVNHEPVPIKKVIPEEIPSPSYVIFLGMGVFLSLLFVITMQLSLKSSATFTALLLKMTWIFIASCGALLFATFKVVNNYDEDSCSYVLHLKKWCRVLVLSIILIIIGKTFELGPDEAAIIEAGSLLIWLTATFIV